MQLYFSIAVGRGVFLVLRLLNVMKETVSNNFYWLPDATGNYSGLQKLAAASPKVLAKKINDHSIKLTMTNPAGNVVAFFNRVSLVNSKTKERLLPAFYSDNYFSVLPGESKSIEIDYNHSLNEAAVEVDGWNTGKHLYSIE
jgi:hypothetical protein